MSDARIIPPEGPRDAKIVIAGEAPGATEDREGRPFVGAAGKVLDALLAEAGIKREACYITNVVKTRPPNNNFEVMYEGKGKARKPTFALLEAIEALHAEIASIRPNVIVPLGNEALKAVMSTSHAWQGNITDWRGSIIDTTLGKVIPTFHPAALMRQWSWRPVALLDMQKVARESAFPDVRRMPRRLEVMPTFDDCMRELRRMRFAPMSKVAFDIETEAGQITAIAFSDRPEWAISIPFWFGMSGNLWSEEEEFELWRAVTDLLEDPTVGKIAQNAQYDITFLADCMDIHVAGLIFDTLVAQHVCYPEMPADLGFLCSIYTDQPYYKSMIDTQDMREFFTYNALDACVTLEVSQALEIELKDLGLTDFYYQHAHKMIEPLIDMARKGVRIDVDARKAEAKRLEASIKEATAQLEAQVGHPLNVASNKQMCDWLYTELRLPPVLKRRSTGGSTPTADDDALASLDKKHAIPAVKTVLAIREQSKILSTYMTPALSPDGRFRASYKIHGTETGRLSSGKYIDGTGGNIQNVPHGNPKDPTDPINVCRRIFIPDPGNVFVECDLSQAEARVVAYLAGEERLIKSFDAGGDIHRRNAANMYGKPESEITFDERQLAKRAVHGLNYGMGVNTFAEQCEISVPEARRVRNLYFSMFPQIELWQKKVAADLRKSRIMTTPMGRKRLFLAQYSEQLIKEALAFVPQSTVADITNRALVDLHAKLPAIDPRCRLAITVHDSIIAECPLELAETVRKAVVDSMTLPLKIGRRVLTIPVDSKVLVNWNDEQPKGAAHAG